MAEDLDYDQLCDHLEGFEAMRDQAEQAIAHVKQGIMDRLVTQGAKSTTTAKGRKITLVEPVRSSWDEAVLKDILGPLWAEVVVVKEILDTNKLDHVVDREKIAPATLQEAVTEKEVKPYIKITNPKVKTR